MSSDLDLYFTPQELTVAFRCKPEVLKTYHQRFRTIFSILEGHVHELAGEKYPSLLISHLYWRPSQVVLYFDQAKKPDGTLYASNTKKNWYDLLISLLPAWRDKLKVKDRASHTVALECFTTEKEKLAAEYIHKPRPNEVTADDIRNGVETLTYGSKARVILKLYMEVPVRDDLQLRFVPTEDGITDDEQNYIYIDMSIKRFKVLIQKSKNVGHDKKQKPRQYVLSEELTREVVVFMKRNTSRKDYPFGSSKLYRYVGWALGLLGLKKGSGAINIIRRALANEAKEKGTEEMAEMAYKMCHTTATSAVAYEDMMIEVKQPAMELHSDNSQEPTEREDSHEAL